MRRRLLWGALLLAGTAPLPALAQMQPPATEPAAAQAEGGATAPQQGYAPAPAGSGESRPNLPVAPTGPGAAPGPQAAAAAPGGYDLGALTLYPSVTIAGFHDDNVFSTSTGRVSDWGVIARPEIALRSNWARHAFEAKAFLESRSYIDNEGEDVINGGVGGATTFDIDPNTQLQSRASFLHAHEERGSGESIFAQPDRPIAYNLFEGSTALNRRFGRWWTSLGVAGLLVDYQNPTFGGIPVDISYRNGNIGVVTSRVGYVVAPLTSLFVEASGNRRLFDVGAFNSAGYRVVGGVLFEPGPGARVKGEAYAGYMNQEYSGFGFAEVSSWTAGGAMSFLVAQGLTVTAEGRREAKESALNGGASLIESFGGVRADWQILPRVAIGGGVTYLADDFQGLTGAGRNDHYWSPLASVKFAVTPAVTLGVDYRGVDFDSNGFGTSGFRRNVVLLSLNARL